jgi:hypothetical protein
MKQRSLLGNWQVLRDDEELGGADVALLCEATGLADLPEEHGFHALGNGSTKARDCVCADLPDGCRGRRYSTAVATPIEGATSIHPIPDSPRPSRPGTWTAATIDVGGLTITAIALYGLHDGGYVASVLRSLDEMAPIVEDGVFGRHLVLGGDLNVLASKRHLQPNATVFERIDRYGLRDCLDVTLPEDRYEDPVRRADMDNCPCNRREMCRHTRTFYSRKHPEIPYQDDYLFASTALADHLVSCHAQTVARASPSDHAPIIAEFEF